jgi:NitT/TauT family transport system substrate-binding protein
VNFKVSQLALTVTESVSIGAASNACCNSAGDKKILPLICRAGKRKTNKVSTNGYNVHEVSAMTNVANFVADPQYIQQAFATSEPFFARQAGIETRVLLTSDAGYNPYRVMFTTRDLLQQRPDVVAKFVRASLKGGSDYLNDPAAGNAAVAKLNPALGPEGMQFSWQALRDGHFVAGDITGDAQLGRMNAERWSTMYQQLLALKVIDKPFDPATAYTLQFVQAK